MPSGPASALVATSILLVEAEGGGRVGTLRWSAASSSVPVGFVLSVPRLSLEGEGGFDAEQDPPPPPSELEVGEWRRRRGRGHIGGRTPHCWGKEARSGNRVGRGRPGNIGPRAGLENGEPLGSRPRRKTRTFWARAVDDSRAVKISLQGPYPSEKQRACLLCKRVSWDSK